MPHDARIGTANLLIDSTHRRWILVTAVLAVLAVGVHAWLALRSPTPLTGGTTVGLWYGVAGSALMVFAGALACHRKLSAIRWLPIRRWIGPRQTWLRGHIWLGLLSAIFVLCHSGYRLGGPLEIALWLVLGVVILSGVFGLLLQTILPRALTSRIQAEAPYEQIPTLCQRMRQHSDELVEEALAGDRLTGSASQALRELHDTVRLYLSEDSRSPYRDNPFGGAAVFDLARDMPGMEPVRDVLDRLQLLCAERLQLARQARLHRWLHLWLLVHVPFSVVLLILGVVHAVMSLYW